MDINFWKSRKVFVTGHTGFKGSWLALWLLSMGAEVCGYALDPPTEPSLYKLLDLDGQFKSVRGDIRDLALLETAMRDFQPEVVFHLAAQPLVRLSYQNPVETYSTNVLGTVHILDAVRRTPSVRSVVMITSDKCYENNEWHWPYREQDAMGGHDPYSSSKGCAELVVSAYRHSFFPPEGDVAVASARAGNVIGGGDWALDRLVPDIARAWGSGKPAIIRNPDAVRPWQHVLEPLSGYMVLAERLFLDGPAFAEGWNFGPADSEARSVGDLVSSLAKLWGHGASWSVIKPEEVQHEAHLLRLDSSKARAELGWSPRWNFDETLAHTIEWYKRFYSSEKMQNCTLEQIELFVSRRKHQKSSDVSA
ncbi:MAG TPA: CDP-glucose 4,6-dehydratase [Candidatus Saccharimonadales bacterium]|nr:CDP-glucose 4,6-dehydratase [Candidatus Saccharimonadales bacterium]